MLDFVALNDFLNVRILEILETIVPGGKLIGREYAAGDKFGTPGDSFKYNIDKHTGQDFATGETFSDVVDLYSKIKSLSQLESATALSDTFGYRPVNDKPDFHHYKHGHPVKTWPYHDASGNIICYVARYDVSATEKSFAPFSLINGRWEMKHLPVPRPLYNLPSLNNHGDRPVLVCEGEKAADAAQAIVGDRYAVISWPCGALATSKVDWSPLSGKRILIWPDADLAGCEAAEHIYIIVSKIAKSVKILDTNGLPQGYDAADFNGNWPDLKQFLLERMPTAQKTVELLTPQPPQATITPSTDPNAPIITGSIHAAWEELGIAVNKSGNAICNMDNITRVFEGCLYFKDNIWYDEFMDTILYRNNGVVSAWTDIHDYNVAIKLQRYLGLAGITDSQVFKAVSSYAHRVTKNCVKDYLDSLVWDKTPRLSRFFQDVCGSADSEYSQAISKNFIMSLVARVYKPGCKADCMPIMECKQGTKKSTMLEVLVGEKFHANAGSNLHHVDFFQCLRGKWLVEFAELHQFSKADINKVKDILSTRKDTYRSSYGRTAADHPRKSVFAGTTNEETYLSDPTGARRFWPIAVNSVDIRFLRDNRDQYFAEAVSLFKSENPANDDDRTSSNWWVVPDSSEAEQESRRVRDPWEDDILVFVEFRNEITMAEILRDCLKIETARKTRFDEMRVGHILKFFGFVRERKRIGSSLTWVYSKKPQSTNIEDVPTDIAQ